jgi:hypothetical protein
VKPGDIKLILSPGTAVAKPVDVDNLKGQISQLSGAAD